ncbi:putative two-component system sensor protein [Lunatimonas lonarensis]|uniref:Putative two-component system sensor protein n=1 Tax=Lunatimonas lonarensis TaxID=1232681 RepID=R7ZX42_9BACT|nr:histidine kinase [Lunatimonas lonarensis]EON78564.1 putative two-component system sensor protein [Lunatimonas lonarensis]
MKPTLFRKNLTVVVHILAWLLVALALFVINPLSWKIDLPAEFWIKQGLILTILIWSFYGNIFFIAPRFLFQEKYGQYLFIALGTGLLFVLLLQKYDSWVEFSRIMHEAFRPGEAYVPKPKSYTWDIVFYLQYALSIGISTSIAAVQKWQMEDLVRRQLEEQKKSSELSYLKAQINPHFFFNTLNNIYALINFDVEKAKAALLKLSRMMRYVLYETEKDKTLLSSEVNFINDYISLMQMRVSEKVKLDIHVQEKVEDIMIAPMLLLPFIENCFKHGVTAGQESHIKINLTMEGNCLQLQTENKINEKNQSSPEINRKGIGLANTLRRLSLLYKNKHTLLIDDTNPEKNYRVDLSINLG